jgi:hypothetical protein
MSFMSLLYPMRQTAQEISAEILGKPSHLYDCDLDDEKAEQVARALLWDWLATKHLVESSGGRFLAILQPVAYFGAPAVGHLELDEELGRQYMTVYPKVRRLVQSEFAPLLENFSDFGDVLDGEDPIYIDFCHVSPEGNEIVAARIGEVLRRGGLRSKARGLAIRDVRMGGAGAVGAGRVGAGPPGPSS